ncbi:DUF7563 family protein [Natronococcus wangiae]
MNNCSRCGEHVSHNFVRVYGVDGEVNGCPRCMTYRELQAGDGAETEKHTYYPYNQ